MMLKGKVIFESSMNPEKIIFILSPTLFSSLCPEKQKRHYN